MHGDDENVPHGKICILMYSLSLCRARNGRSIGGWGVRGGEMKPSKLWR